MSWIFLLLAAIGMGLLIVFSIVFVVFIKKAVSPSKKSFSYHENEVFDWEKESKMIKDLQEDYINRLSQVGQLDQDQIKAELSEELKQKYSKDLIEWKKNKQKQILAEVQTEAINMIGLAIDRNSSKVANDFTVINIELNDESEKSKLIGKDGRNIQYFESLTGIAMVIDNNGLIISLSGYDSVRRSAAKITIEKMLRDGQINPPKIKQYWLESEKEIESEILKQGNLVVDELGINDFPIELIKLVGRLHFRSSYGQNVLKHSKEVAKLAKLLALQLNEKFIYGQPIDEIACIKGGLLHDIGKALDEQNNFDKGHVYYGHKVVKEFGLDSKTVECVIAQENILAEGDNKFSIEAIIVNAADSISASRKGARKGEKEAIDKRLKDINKVVESFYGVSKSWIMKGGREIWVFFDTTKINAYQLDEITSKISKEVKKVEQFSGEIKIVGKWEEEFTVDLH